MAYWMGGPIKVDRFGKQAIAAILRVTNDWKTSVGGLDSQLMHASGLGRQLKKAAIGGYVVGPQARLRLRDLCPF